MPRPISLFLLHAAPLLLLSMAAPARADGEAVPDDLSRIVFDTGRIAQTVADPDHLRIQMHGEYQLRWQSQSSFPLTPTANTVSAHPNAVSDSIGQNGFLWHWLRLTPRIDLGDKLALIAQADLGGLVIGELAHDTYADQTPRDSYDGFSNLQPRWLYLEWLTKIGLLRVGQQGSHWGMGIVANDGDHPSLFGDYRYGNITEQILFATKPAGEKSPFVVALAGGLVYRDNIAQLSNGDRAWQGVLAAFYERGPNMLGVYGVYRSQSRDRTSNSDIFPYTESIDAGVLDVAGHFAAPVFTPGEPAWVFGSFEAATILGTTNSLRTLDETVSGQRTKLQSYGGAATLGFVIGAHKDARAYSDRLQPGAMPGAPAGGDASSGARPELYGKLVTQVEVGYASGEADPNGDTNKRFTFDPNHKVGLLLFDEVMRWQTARAATAARDPLLSNAQNAPPGVDLLPSNGGVFGAQYINPTMIYRPRHWLDLKGGVVVAQSTADVVDPYRLVTQGAYVNYQGGDTHRHDLGVEVDTGVEARFPLDARVRLQVGAQGGVLFPGGALADASGATMKTPWIAIGRLGLQF